MTVCPFTLHCIIPWVHTVEAHTCRIKSYQFSALNVVKIRATCPAVSLTASPSRSPSMIFGSILPLNLSGCHRRISDRITLACPPPSWSGWYTNASTRSRVMSSTRRTSSNTGHGTLEKPSCPSAIGVPQCVPFIFINTEPLGQAWVHRLGDRWAFAFAALALMTLPLLGFPLLLLLYGSAMSILCFTLVLLEQECKRLILCSATRRLRLPPFLLKLPRNLRLRLAVCAAHPSRALLAQAHTFRFFCCRTIFQLIILALLFKVSMPHQGE